MDAESGDLTIAVQDYLRAIYALESTGTPVTTSALATRMGVKPPSATAMTKRLAELGLVERRPYKGVALTEIGKRGALEVLRHHRLLERYLADRLGFSIDEVHAEADRLEHALSEELEAKIDEELGYPTHDPHGGPIPDSKLRVRRGGDRSLVELAVGERATVSQIPDGDAALLRYLTELGLVPGSEIEVVEIAPFSGPITLRTMRGEHAISRELGQRIGALALRATPRRQATMR
jgi:DtxR family transcriptional regulator, Mn-dependent transcriptional regulator